MGPGHPSSMCSLHVPAHTHCLSHLSWNSIPPNWKYRSYLLFLFSPLTPNQQQFMQAFIPMQFLNMVIWYALYPNSSLQHLLLGYTTIVSYLIALNYLLSLTTQSSLTQSPLTTRVKFQRTCQNLPFTCLKLLNSFLLQLKLKHSDSVPWPAQPCTTSPLSTLPLILYTQT